MCRICICTSVLLVSCCWPLSIGNASRSWSVCWGSAAASFRETFRRNTTGSSLFVTCSCYGGNRVRLGRWTQSERRRAQSGSNWTLPRFNWKWYDSWINSNVVSEPMCMFFFYCRHFIFSCKILRHFIPPQSSRLWLIFTSEETQEELTSKTFLQWWRARTAATWITCDCVGSSESVQFCWVWRKDTKNTSSQRSKILINTGLDNYIVKLWLQLTWLCQA